MCLTNTRDQSVTKTRVNQTKRPQNVAGPEVKNYYLQRVDLESCVTRAVALANIRIQIYKLDLFFFCVVFTNITT